MIQGCHYQPAFDSFIFDSINQRVLQSLYPKESPYLHSYKINRDNLMGLNQNFIPKMKTSLAIFELNRRLGFIFMPIFLIF